MQFILLGISLAVLFAYLAVLLVVYLKQSSYLYVPTHVDSGGEGGHGLEPWMGAGGNFLGYWRPASAPKKVLIFFHGNAGEALDRTWLLEVIPDSTALIIVEYPGFGARSGEPSEASLYAAAIEAFDVARDRFKLPITVVGHSLGSGPASYVACHRTVEKLGLISPFTSATDVIKRKYPFVPVRLLFRDKFDVMKNLEKVIVPLQIMHGTLDDLTPLEMAKRIAKAYRGPKELHEILGFGHENMNDALIESPFADRFRAFLAE